MSTPVQPAQHLETAPPHPSASGPAETAKSFASLIPRKVEDVSCYDVIGMNRVAAISYFGRSGSYLLASYLDSHPDVLMLPPMQSRMIYPFFEQHPSLSLPERMADFPNFVALYGVQMFAGEFAISEAAYRAASAALLAAYRDASPEFLNSRRAFVVFIHVAYSLALGRRSGTAQPLMVYSYHYHGSAIAEQIAVDFPEPRFIHTVRDPISGIDSHFSSQFMNQLAAILDKPALETEYFDPTWWVVRDVIGSDQPYHGMAELSRAVRFEDLHTDLPGTMERLAAWLGLPLSPTLLRSTFNGVEWVVGKGPGAHAGRGGLLRSYYQQRPGEYPETWSGPRPEQTRRHWRNLFPWDRALLYALFYDGFQAWGYPCPSLFGFRLVRRVTAAVLWLLPMKMELLVLRSAMRRQCWPALRHGRVFAAARVLARLASGRLSVRRLITVTILHRTANKPQVLALLEAK